MRLPSLNHPGVRLFILSFTALFLELLVIRWVPSLVRLIAYYANLMLISSFLGLGLGAMLSTRRRGLLKWFQPCMAMLVLCVVVFRGVAIPGSGGEARFFEGTWRVPGFAVLLGIFILNTLMFIPIGQEIGRLFGLLPPLRAYSWDLLGSLAGTLVFGAFSVVFFSPFIGFLVVIGIHALLLGRRQIGYSLLPGVCILLVLSITNNRDAIWSAYHYLTIHDTFGGQVSEVEPRHQTRINPMPYIVRVNQDFYQSHSTVDPSRFTPGSLWGYRNRVNMVHYPLPYHIRPNPVDVLVLGAGGGLDVEAALLAGAKSVDAVDIDAAIMRISRTYAATDVYGDPRVRPVADDARAFLERDPKTYDVVAFGLLDSQNLFSYGSSLRIDGYIYTVECFRRAMEHVRDGGMLEVSFAVEEPWVRDKLVRMLHEATGKLPIVYRHDTENVMLIPKFEHGPVPDSIEMYEHIDVSSSLDSAIPIATDNWPYLYLKQASIPTDYLTVIGTLLLISAAGVFGLRGSVKFGSSDLHFFFLGWGFLLLQTKSIGDCSLYFGTTWVVSLIVISGTLMMVLAANLIAMRLKRLMRIAYVPLLLSILVLALMPRQIVLSWPFAGRLTWALIAVPLPIFFAGLIFSATFRQTAHPAECFGANLLGATVGGFCEYLGMWLGTSALSWIIIGAYVLSFICLTLRDRGTLIERGSKLSFAQA